jgi:hypothetical protein
MINKDKKEVSQDKSTEKILLHQSFSQEMIGIIPSASEIELYNKTNPEIVKFIIKDAEIRRDESIKASNRQFDIIEKEQQNKQVLNKISMIAGGIVSTFVICCSVYLSITGDIVTAGILAGSNISFIVMAFASFLKK